MWSEGRHILSSAILNGITYNLFAGVFTEIPTWIIVVCKGDWQVANIDQVAAWQGNGLPNSGMTKEPEVYLLEATTQINGQLKNYFNMVDGGGGTVMTPDEYAALIIKKLKVGEQFTDPVAAWIFVQANPAYFVGINTSPLKAQAWAFKFEAGIKKLVLKIQGDGLQIG